MSKHSRIFVFRSGLSSFVVFFLVEDFFCLVGHLLYDLICLLLCNMVLLQVEHAQQVVNRLSHFVHLLVWHVRDGLDSVLNHRRDDVLCSVKGGDDGFLAFVRLDNFGALIRDSLDLVAYLLDSRHGVGRLGNYDENLVVLCIIIVVIDLYSVNLDSVLGYVDVELFNGLDSELAGDLFTLYLDFLHVFIEF